MRSHATASPTSAPTVKTTSASLSMPTVTLPASLATLSFSQTGKLAIATVDVVSSLSCIVSRLIGHHLKSD